MGLEHSMKKSSLPYKRKNIWDDPKAAEFVRSVANGNEVVPTVTIGKSALVNPSLNQIVQAIGHESPGLMTDEELAKLTELQAGPLGKLVRRILPK